MVEVRSKRKAKKKKLEIGGNRKRGAHKMMSVFQRKEMDDTLNLLYNSCETQ